MSTVLKNLSETKGEIPSGKNRKFVICVSEWNGEITSVLLSAAEETLEKHGAQTIIVSAVPGCFELPLAAQKMIERHKPDAVICLGCVIRGETPHFDYVCQAAAQGISEVGLKTGIPVVFGVLTVNTVEQARDRAGGKYGNKGVEAAYTALKMTEYL